MLDVSKESSASKSASDAKETAGSKKEKPVEGALEMLDVSKERVVRAL